jgi:NAD(P)-dependent dehydrogenase (short-subunit alcohol dehydrogenase family)
MAVLSGKTVLHHRRARHASAAPRPRGSPSAGAQPAAARPAGRIEGGAAFAAAVAVTHGVTATYVGQDLNDLAAAERTGRNRFRAAHGGIDILINNAALIINKPFEEFSLEEYEDQVRVNSSAAFALGARRRAGDEGQGATARSSISARSP